MNNNFYLDQNNIVDFIAEVPYGIIVFDGSGNVLLSNDLAYKFFELDKSEVSIQKLVASIDIVELNELILQTLEGTRKRFDILEMNYNDRVLTVRCRSNSRWSILTVQDITKWKEIELASVQSIIETQEKERKRIAADIHDGIGPQISGAVHNLEVIKSKLTDELQSKMVNETIESLKEVSNDVRSLSHALIPRVLSDFGLVAALESLVSRYRESGRYNIELITSFTGEPIEESIALNLYRIAQELIHNAIKHSDCDNIFVQLVKSDERIMLSVEDDGVGFNIQEINALEGIGISNIEMRTKVIGGELLIDSMPGRGTVVSVEIIL